MPHIDLVVMATKLDELIPAVEKLTADVATVADRCNLLNERIDDLARAVALNVSRPSADVQYLDEQIRKLRGEIETVRNLLPAKP